MIGCDGLQAHVQDRILTLTLSRPERKNALTFEIYEHLRDGFRGLRDDETVRAIILRGDGENFCSGGDVHEIIGPLTQRDAAGLEAFTQMTGDVVKAMRATRAPIVAAIDGVCAGAGAILAMASDLRYATPRSRIAFLFVRVGLAGCDMGACALLPRMIGLGRAAELLYLGRSIDGETAQAWGFVNALCEPDGLDAHVQEVASQIACGPTKAHAVTKRMLDAECCMPLNQAIDAEAHAQASLMQTQDFRRAYEAFVYRRKPTFAGD